MPPLMCMARWDSLCVLTYLKNAPLDLITSQYIAGSAAPSGQASSSKGVDTVALKKFGNKVIQDLNAMKAEAARHDEELTTLGKRLEILDAMAVPKYIVSDKYQKWHVCLVYTGLPIKEMKTRCGWRYGMSIFVRKSFTPDRPWLKYERCPRCFDLAEDGN